MDLEVMEKRALGKIPLRFYPTKNIWEIIWGALVDNTNSAKFFHFYKLHYNKNEKENDLIVI